eukprot:433568_1
MVALWSSLYLLTSIFCTMIATISARSEERIYYFGFEELSDWTADVGSFDSSRHTFKPITWYNWDGDFQNCPRYNDGVRSEDAASCLRLFMDASISRFISTLGYHSIHLQIDVNPQSVEHQEDEWCFVQYRTTTTNWITTNIVNGHDAHVLDFDITIPDNNAYNNQSSFQVRIGIHATTGGDSCLFDNLEVFGVSYPTTATGSSGTPRPTLNPSPNPTSKPTSNPTSKPTRSPTPRPTNPDISTCDDTVIGAYNGIPVTFIVHMPYKGDLQFGVTSSSFIVTDIEAFTKLNVPLATDADHDEMVTLMDTYVGDYIFIINGEGTQTGTIEVRIRCFSDAPTSKPTLTPTTNPTSSANPTTEPMQPVSVPCGQDIVGAYYTGVLIFETTMPFAGILSFDASGSDFPITIKAYTKLDSLLAIDADDNEVITLSVPAGDYQFSMAGNTQSLGIYHVKVSCQSANGQTSIPTHLPTFGSTLMVVVAQTTDIGLDIVIRVIVAVISALGAGCCLCGCVVFVCYKCVKNKTKHQGDQNEMVNIIGHQCHQTQHIAQASKTDWSHSNIPQTEVTHPVVSWFQHIQLPQYVSLFVNEGYDTMQAIQAIETKQEILELGVEIHEHQTLILNEIRKLQRDEFMVDGIPPQMTRNWTAECALTMVMDCDESGSSDSDALMDMYDSKKKKQTSQRGE